MNYSFEAGFKDGLHKGKVDSFNQFRVVCVLRNKCTDVCALAEKPCLFVNCRAVEHAKISDKNG